MYYSGHGKEDGTFHCSDFQVKYEDVIEDILVNAKKMFKILPKDNKRFRQG